MKSFLLAVGAAALATAGCAQTGMAPAPGSAAAGIPLPDRGPAYVAMAASSDMYEQESSRMAMQRSRDPRHQQFAQMMIRDHGTTTANLAAAARSSGIEVPTEMMPMHRQMVDQLSRAPNFDAAYHRQQIQAHELALGTHSTFANRGDVPALRTVASSAVPIVQMHLNQLRSMGGR